MSGRLLEGLGLVRGQSVAVTNGAHVGQLGSVISVEELGPDPVFLVELGCGDDVALARSCLRAVDQ